MARTDNLTNFLTDTAEAIREKLNKADPIMAADFDKKIREISGGAEVHEIGIVIGNTVNVGDATSMTNPWGYPVGTWLIYNYAPTFGADVNKQGIVLGMITNADGGMATIVYQHKYAFATGGGDGEVKLFETIEEMHANPGNDGDKAIVYNKSIQNYNGEDTFDSLVFPDKVVLPEPNTTSSGAYFRPVDPSKWADAMVDIGPTSFSFMFYGEDTNFTIRYTSGDGETYIRTDAIGNPVEFGMELKRDPGTWNNALGYFMQKGGYRFDGLFEYINTPNKDTVGVLDSYTYEQVGNILTPVIRPTDVDFSIINKAIAKMNLVEGDGEGKCIIVDKDVDGKIIKVHCYDLSYCYVEYFNNEMSLLSADTSTTATKYAVKRTYTVATDTVTDQTVTSTPYTRDGSTTRQRFERLTGADWFSYKTTKLSLGRVVVWVLSNGTNTYEMKHVNMLMWVPATTQFDATASDLFTNKIAYGKTGEIIGDGTVFTKMTFKQFCNNILGVQNDKLSENTNFIQIDNTPYIELDKTKTNKLFGITTDIIPDAILKLPIVEKGVPVELLNNVPYRSSYTIARRFGDKILMIIPPNIVTAKDFTICIFSITDTGLVLDKMTGFTANYGEPYAGDFHTISDKLYFDFSLTHSTTSVSVLRYDITANTVAVLRTITPSGTTTAYITSIDVVNKVIYWYKTNGLFYCNYGADATVRTIVSKTYTGYPSDNPINDSLIYATNVCTGKLLVVKKATKTYFEIDVAGLPSYRNSFNFSLGGFTYVITGGEWLVKIKESDDTYEIITLSSSLGRSVNDGPSRVVVFPEEPDIAYMLTQTSKSTSSGGNTSVHLYSLNLKTLEIVKYGQTTSNYIYYGVLTKVGKTLKYNTVGWSGYDTEKTIIKNIINYFMIGSLVPFENGKHHTLIDGSQTYYMYWYMLKSVFNDFMAKAKGLSGGGPISQEEYDTAIDTAKNILGGEAND